MAAHKPQRELGFSVRELRVGHRDVEKLSLRSWGGRFQALDRALQFYERHPIRSLREHAMRVGAEWILRRRYDLP